MGFSKRNQRKNNYKTCQQKQKCFKQETLGVTTGLVYLPGEYTTRKEILEICKIAAKYGCFYATHMRTESDEVEQALEETIDVAKEAGGAFTCISLKSNGI